MLADHPEAASSDNGHRDKVTPVARARYKALLDRATQVVTRAFPAVAGNAVAPRIQRLLDEITARIALELAGGLEALRNTTDYRVVLTKPVPPPAEELLERIARAYAALLGIVGVLDSRGDTTVDGVADSVGVDTEHTDTGADNKDDDREPETDAPSRPTSQPKNIAAILRAAAEWQGTAGPGKVKG